MRDALLLRPNPSRTLVGLSSLLFVLLAFSLWTAELPLWLRLILLFSATAASLHLLISHGLRRGPLAVTAVEWLGEGRWRLTDGRGVRREVRRLEGGVVHHRLVAVPFAVGRRRYSLLLTRDAVDDEGHRRLRARLLDG